MADNGSAIRKSDPDIPEAIFNRKADNWAPLLAIAEVAGPMAAHRAKEASLEACAIKEDQSFNTQLLGDIREVIEAKGGTYITSAELVAALVAMTDRPWGECNHGKAMTQNGLARRLKGFGIGTINVGPKKDRAKGYEFESFTDTFSRFIAGFQTVHPITSNKINNVEQKQSVHQKKGCTDENDANSLKSNDVCGGTVQNGESGEIDDGDGLEMRF